MNWLVENSTGVYLLLAVVAVGLAAFGWLQQRVKFYAYAVGVLVLLLLVWLLINHAPSDRRQLEDNVHAMKDAVLLGSDEALLKHLSKDFRYQNATRDDIARAAREAVKGNRVESIRITKFSTDEINRDKKSARVRFRVTAWAAGQDQPFMFNVIADFVLEGTEWKLRTVRFLNPWVNQDEEIVAPIGR